MYLNLRWVKALRDPAFESAINTTNKLNQFFLSMMIIYKPMI